MEQFTLNLRGQTRRVTENGVAYLVAPLTSITADGVLPGSRGPLLYPASEIKRSVPEWDGTPLTNGHPFQHGQPCSAMDVPEQHLGEIRNTRFDGKLKHEAWFVEDKVRRHSPEIHEALVNHRPMECSSGLYTTNLPAPNGHAVSVHGRPYVAVATSYVPDHMAILPREVGACSLQDGCGLMVNSKGELTNNPAVSEAQRRYLNATFDHEWVKAHGFDNHGELPDTVDEDGKVENAAMNQKQKLRLWQRLGAELGLTTNSNGDRHHHTGRFADGASSQAVKGFSDLNSTTDDDEPRTEGRNLPGDDGRDTVKTKRVPTDLDGDGDGPVDDYWWRNIDESGEQTEPAPPQFDNDGGGPAKTGHVGGRTVLLGEMENNAMKKQRCPDCGGDVDEDGECEDCGEMVGNANPEGKNQYTDLAGGKHDDRRSMHSANQKHAKTLSKTAKEHDNSFTAKGATAEQLSKSADLHLKAHEVHKALGLHDTAQDHMDAALSSRADARELKNKSKGTANAGLPSASGMAMGDAASAVAQPEAHAATTQAAQASLDHPPARSHAVAAFDHSKGGKSKWAATRHDKAADAHDEAMQDSIQDHDTDAADGHANAAMLHRKAAAMHHAMTTNDFDVPASKAGMGVPEYAAVIGKLEGSYEGSAGGKSKAAGAASKEAGSKGTKGAHKAAASAHKAAAKAHEKQGSSHEKGSVESDHHNRQADMHRAKAAAHEKAAGKMSRNELHRLNGIIANCTCLATKRELVRIRNAKLQGSNEDATGSGDFDDALIAGGWDDSPDDDEANYQNKYGKDVDPDDTEDEADDEPLKTGGDGATPAVRGRKGVSNQRITQNQADQFSRAIFGKPLAAVREEARLVANVMRQQKTQIIRQLVGHLPREHATALVQNHKLYERSIEELRDMLHFQRPQEVRNLLDDRHEEPVYLGASLVPPLTNGHDVTVNANDASDIECMVSPTINFRQWQEEDRAVRSSGGNRASAVGRQHTSAEDAM